MVEQEARDEIEPFITGSAGNACEARQALSIAQDFFGHDIEGAVLRTPCDFDQPLQPPEILMRITQPVDVVKAQAMQRTFADETANENMDRVERGPVFDAQTGQGIAVE